MNNINKHILSVFMVITVAIFAVGSTDTETDTQEVKSTKPVHSVSANELHYAYSKNEVAAERKYKHKVIKIKGVIQDIGTILDEPYIIMGGTGMLDGVHCSFSKSQTDSIIKVSKGQTITVKGKVDMKMGNIMISGCIIL